MPSFGWWILGSETVKFLLALAVAFGLVAVPFVAWGLMWKGWALTQRSDNDDVYRLLAQNQRLDELLDEGRKHDVP